MGAPPYVKPTFVTSTYRITELDYAYGRYSYVQPIFARSTY